MGMFFVIDIFFENFEIFKALYFPKLMSIFCQLNLEFDAQPESRILKVINWYYMFIFLFFTDKV